METEAGCSLIEKIEYKYLDDDDATVEEFLLTGFTGCSPCKMASQRGLEMVVLNNMNINSAGDTTKLANLVRHVSEVDLGWNQLANWEEIALIMANLPNMRCLNLGHNPIGKELTVELPSLPRLHTLILNGTNLPLSTLRKLLSVLPNLSELHMSDNCLEMEENEENVEPISEKVHTLHLNRCGISDWQNALKILAAFPNRKTVFMCENPIKSIEHHQISQQQLNTLTTLNLTKTEIDTWESIDNLDKLPALAELRIPNIPLLDEYSEEERIHLIIGRIEKLRELNGSDISPQQRETSERFFIRYFQDSENKPSQYNRLIEKHGNLERLVKVDLKPKITVSVNAICEEKNYAQKLKLHLNKNLGDLMKFLEKDTGIPYNRIRLFHITPDGQVEECRFPNMPLHTLRIDDGDTLNIQSKIVPNRRRKPLVST